VISDNYRHFAGSIGEKAKNGEPVLAQLMRSEEREEHRSAGSWHGTQTVYYPKITIVIGRIANNTHDANRVMPGNEYNIVFADYVVDAKSGEKLYNYWLRHTLPESVFSSQKADLEIIRVADPVELNRHIERKSEEFRMRFAAAGGYRLNWGTPEWKIPAMVLYLNTDAIAQYMLRKYGAANIHPIFRELKMELPRNARTQKATAPGSA
jgi:hypothetical protein